MRVSDLHAGDLTLLSSAHLANIETHVAKVGALLRGMESWRPDQNNATPQRTSLITQVAAESEAALSELALPRIILKAQPSDIDRSLTEMRVKAEKALSSLAGYDGRAKEMVKVLEETTARRGASDNARWFRSEAIIQRNAAHRWLMATALLAAITAGTAVSFMIWTMNNPPGGTGEMVSLTALKVLFLSVLSYIVVFAAGNYKAHRHNETINTHREQALSTFETFHSAASDENIRGAILGFAAQTVFSNRPTGFESAGEQAAPSSHVIEVVRALGPAKPDKD